MPFSKKKFADKKNTNNDDDMSSISNITKDKLKRKPSIISPVARKKKSSGRSVHDSYNMEENVSPQFFSLFLKFSILIFYYIGLQWNQYKLFKI